MTGMSLAFSRISRVVEPELARLFYVWESAVRATHDFLDERQIEMLMPMVRHELASFPEIHCLRDRSGEPYAFMGVANGNIEMLFVHADHQGFGAGRLLTQLAIERLRATTVDVNEQNQAAVGFYRHLGFQPVARSMRDPLGNPFPILHMALRTASNAHGTAPAHRPARQRSCAD
jgi:putative acetyltransferase